MKLGMLHSAINADDADGFIKETDDFLNENDSDEYNFSVENDDTFTVKFNPTKKHHRFQDNEAIEVVKMTKIRHHNSNNAHQASTGHCSNVIGAYDGYTIADKTRLYKMCEPVQKLPLCR